MNSTLNNLIWIDLEMTGLNTSRDYIIEIATIVTDDRLNIIAQGPVIAIYQPPKILDKMDEWNSSQHRKSGLLNRVSTSSYSVLDAERKTLVFLEKFVTAGKSPMCGSSICQDRRFMYRLMPKLRAIFPLSQSRCEFIKGNDIALVSQRTHLRKKLCSSCTR